MISRKFKSNDQNIPYFVLVGGGRRKLHEPMTDMKIKTGIKKNPVRGPLKAMPQTAMKPTRDPPMTTTKSVFKRLQPSNTSSSSNTSMVEVCCEKRIDSYPLPVSNKLRVYNRHRIHTILYQIPLLSILLY